MRKPVNADPRWELTQADCEVAMASIESGSVDLVYADPPFATNLVQRGRSAARSRTSSRYPYNSKWSEPAVSGAMSVIISAGRVGAALAGEAASGEATRAAAAVRATS